MQQCPVCGGYFGVHRSWCLEEREKNMPICPECRDGKHNNCTEFAFHPVSDERVPCACPNPYHTKEES